MIQAIIIDDEFRSRSILRQLVEKYCNNVELIGVAESADIGRELVNELRPGIVFLDIEMPNINGFDFLDSFTEKTFQTIAITAHSDYKIKAIQYNVAAFLLKPVDIDELKSAIGVAEQRVFDSLQHPLDLNDGIR